MISVIDTTSADEAKLFLLDDNYQLILKRSFLSKNSLSEKLLLEIDVLLHASGTQKKDLTKILVNLGPGSYTGLRIGLSTANFMAYSLNIPIIGYRHEESETEDAIISRLIKEGAKRQGKSFASPVVPFYKMPPHITKNKSC